MPFDAVVVKVMIASPGDVPAERQAVRDIIAEWNSVHAERARLVLMPVGWETHSVPEMGDRPQAIINRQVLASCDVLVAAFWTRLGSATGKAASGTVEEIEEHLAAGRPAMLYFSNAPVVPGSIDLDQYAALTAFKKACMVRGLIHTYDDNQGFRDGFRRHLAQLVGERFAGVQTEAEVGARPTEPALGEDARDLLLAAATHPHGRILAIKLLSGLRVEVGDRIFCAHGNARSEARWRGAIDELEAVGLIEPTSFKREGFAVTREGYAAADALSLAVGATPADAAGRPAHDGSATAG